MINFEKNSLVIGLSISLQDLGNELMEAIGRKKWMRAFYEGEEGGGATQSL